MRHSFAGLLLVAAFTTVFSASFSTVLAAEPQSPGTESEIEPRVRQLLESAFSTVGKSEAVAVRILTKMKISDGTQNMDVRYQQQLKLQRPNRLALESSGGPNDMARSTLISDGEQLYQFVGFLEKYSLNEANDDLAFVAENPFLGQGGLGGALFVPIFVQNDGAQKFLENVTAGKYLAVEELDGEKVHHVQLTVDQVDWELWIDAGQPGLIRQAVPNLSKLFQTAGAQQGNPSVSLAQIKVEATVSFKQWDLAPKFTAADFKIEPNPTAEQVDSLFDALQTPHEAPHPLLGKRAPGFRLDLVGGDKVSLRQHADKQIVILDFWATWCGPCRAAMPKLAKVAAAFKDKGVVLYGVNMEEDEETIQEFLQQQDFDLRVLRDIDGQTAASYQVEGIPQTVVIGKDGVVHAVHVGLLPDLEQRLTAEIEALLEGKNLAAKTLAEQE